MIKNKYIFLIVAFSALIYSFTPKESDQKFYLPNDLKIELWAESPLLYNPTNMDTDLKGRIWVTEGVNYRKFNNDSNTFFHQEKGDRIVILSDTNQDGLADKSQVFVQDKDLVAPLGIAVFGNEIIVSCAPYLIKYTDLDADDKPDKKEILLKGFGGFNHDHSLHSVLAGPDGKWHFSVGNAGPHVVTDKSGFTLRSGSIYTGGTPYNDKNQSNLVSDDGKVWVGGLQLRLNSDLGGLKVMAHNFRNSYETYVDGHGDMWQNDNDDQVVTCRVSWLSEGGDAGFFSKDGSRFWNADQRPGQNMFRAHWHQDDPAVMPAGDNSGAGSPTGMLRIESNSLGKKYQGMVISADAGRNVLFAYLPKVKDSGHNLNGKKQILVSSNFNDDPSYQWNNTNFLNDLSKWFRPSDIMIGSDGALYIADWYDAVVGGHRLQDTKGHGRIYRVSPKNAILKTPKIELNTLKGQILAFKNPAVHVKYQAFLKLKNTNIASVLPLLKDSNPFIKSRAIWLIASMGKEGQEKIKEILKTGFDQERIVAIRALRQNLSKEDFLTLTAKLINDGSAFVRREAILGLEGLPYIKVKNTLKAFAEKTPVRDTFYTNVLALILKGNEDEFFNENKAWFKGHFDLAFALFPSAALSYFETLIKKPETPFDIKTRALTAIGFIKSKDAVNAMVKFSKSKDNKVANIANYWLSFKSTNDWFDLYDWNQVKDLKDQINLNNILAKKEIVSNNNIAFNDRKYAAITMLKYKEGGQIILDLIQKKQLTPDILESIEPLLINHSESAISNQAKRILNTNVIYYNKENVIGTHGDFAEGKKVFETYCNSCHKKGEEIGPSLTKISEKLEKKGMYEALVNPSASLVFGYETITLETKNGNVLVGFLVSENENLIAIKDLSGKLNTVLRKEIKSKTPDKKSIMPTASSLGIKETELKDLIEFLTKTIN